MRQYFTLSVPPYSMRKNPHVDEVCCIYDDKVLSITWSTNEISTWQHDIYKCRSTSSKQHQFDELALRKVGYTHKRKTHFSTDHCKSSFLASSMSCKYAFIICTPVIPFVYPVNASSSIFCVQISWVDWIASSHKDKKNICLSFDLMISFIFLANIVLAVLMG